MAFIALFYGFFEDLTDLLPIVDTKQSRRAVQIGLVGLPLEMQKH